MKDQGEFGERRTTPTGKSGDGSSDRLDCAAVEVWWTEAVEGTLPDAVAERLRAHSASCASCREKIELARRGHEWLLILKQEPLAPPTDMVAKILAKTLAAPEMPVPLPKPGIPGVLAGYRGHHAAADSLSGFAAAQDRGVRPGAKDDYDRRANDKGTVSSPAVWQHASVVLLRRTVLDPRIALVAAMAFFSIALTLNLAGVKLTKLRAADLEPQSMRRAVTRQYAEANARIVRYYENLRIVYEVESRVHQLRQAADSGPQQAPSSGKSGKRSSNSGRDSGSDPTESHRAGITINSDAHGIQHGPRPDPKPVIVGPRFDAAFRVPMQSSMGVWREDPPIGLIFTPSKTEVVAFRLPFQDAQRTFSSVYRTACFSMLRFSTQERRLA